MKRVLKLKPFEEMSIFELTQWAHYIIEKGKEAINKLESTKSVLDKVKYEQEVAFWEVKGYYCYEALNRKLKKS